MAKTETLNSGVASRTRKKISDRQKETRTTDDLRAKFKIQICTVKLKRLSANQIIDMIGGDLMHITDLKKDEANVKKVETSVKKGETSVNKCETNSTSTTARSYNLRGKKPEPKRENLYEHKNPNERKKAAKVCSSLISPSDLTAAALWKFLKTNVPPLAEKKLVLAKMRTYCPWPAMITSVNTKRIEVYFFGEGRTGTVNSNEIVPFERCGLLIRKYLNTAGYQRAVRELELAANVPISMSVTNVTNK